MKKLLILAMIIGGSLVANSAYSQIHIEAQFGPTERDYPGYTYYTYPAWRGHYRDQVYYRHYRPVFYREHRQYFRGRRQFDHGRWDREHGNARRDDRRDDRRDHRH